MISPFRPVDLWSPRIAFGAHRGSSIAREGLHAVGWFDRDSRLLVAAKDAVRHNGAD